MKPAVDAFTPNLLHDGRQGDAHHGDVIAVNDENQQAP